MRSTPGFTCCWPLGCSPPCGQVGAIVITPTRELAIQIDEVLSHFTKHFPQFSQILWIGGRNPGEDVERFKQHGWVSLRVPAPVLCSCWTLGSQAVPLGTCPPPGPLGSVDTS